MPSRFYQKVISLSKTPADFLETQAIERTQSATVVDYPTTTVVGESAASVVDTPTTTVPVTDLWRAEANGALFPRSRIRPIERAQDALTHVEESVYDALWGPKNQIKESHRSVQIGYGQIAKSARITKRNAALIVERLIEKGFVVLER